MRADYVPSIDWLKAIGITLIVFGHLAHGAIAGLVPPIYPKQFGVAMFLYASAYGLARERRSSWRAVANRLFEMFLFGVVIAVLLSGIGYALEGDIRESNYLPFVGGVNVVLDYFPANPTTWFIGMYLQILLIWAMVLRQVRVSVTLIALVAVGEIALRTLLMERAGNFVAYMNVSNWLTVFLLGSYHGQRGRTPGSDTAWWRAGLPLAALVIAWSALIGPVIAVDSFPFMRLATPGFGGALAASIGVTFLYASVTLLTVATVGSLQTPAGVRYVARNTVIVFIGHMPLYYALHPLLKQLTTSYWLIVAIEMVPCYFGLLWVSERVRSVVDPVRLRDRLFNTGPTFSSVPQARATVPTDR